MLTALECACRGCWPEQEPTELHHWVPWVPCGYRTSAMLLNLTFLICKVMEAEADGEELSPICTDE